MQRDNVAVIERHRYLEVLHEFTMRQASMKSVDDICWNIAKTAIGELGFVDCVVYLMNEAHSELVQRAAHGNKNPGEREILDPIATPVGEGIVGSVAETGVLERVEDTRDDERYILDHSFRCSELAVPILREGKVIGVLDSEHPEPHFFPTRTSNSSQRLPHWRQHELTQHSRLSDWKSKPKNSLMLGERPRRRRRRNHAF